MNGFYDTSIQDPQFSGKHRQMTTREIRDELAGWNHSGAEDTSILVSVIMALCDRIDHLEKQQTPAAG